MTPSDFEHDLLGYVEGTLPPGREEAVREAISRDPSLARRLELMREDRRDLVESTARPAPAGVVGDAVAQAEREALFESARRPRRRRSWVPAAALAAVLGLAAIGSLGIWFGIERGHEARISPASTDADAPFHRLREREEPLDLEEDPVELAAATVPDDLTTIVRIEPVEAEAAVVEAPGPIAGDDLVDRWAAEVEEKIGADAQDGPVTLASLADASGMTVAEAISLARAGRLRIEARALWPDEVLASLAAPVEINGDAVAQLVWRERMTPADASLIHDLAAPDPDAEPPAPRGSAPAGEPEESSIFGRVELLVGRNDPDLGAAIDGLIGVLDDAGARADRLESMDAGAGDSAAPVSWRPSDVVWWSESPDRWSSRIGVRVTVHIGSSIDQDGG